MLPQTRGRAQRVLLLRCGRAKRVPAGDDMMQSQPRGRTPRKPPQQHEQAEAGRARRLRASSIEVAAGASPRAGGRQQRRRQHKRTKAEVHSEEQESIARAAAHGSRGNPEGRHAPEQDGRSSNMRRPAAAGVRWSGD